MSARHDNAVLGGRADEMDLTKTPSRELSRLRRSGELSDAAYFAELARREVERARRSTSCEVRELRFRGDVVRQLVTKRRRHAGAKLCAKCGYDLRGVVCPECGESAVSVRSPVAPPMKQQRDDNAGDPAVDATIDLLLVVCGIMVAGLVVAAVGDWLSHPGW